MIFFLLYWIHLEVAAGQPFNLLFNKLNTFCHKSVLYLFFSSSQPHSFSLNSLQSAAQSLIFRPHTGNIAPKRAELVLNQRRGIFILSTCGVISWEPSANLQHRLPGKYCGFRERQSDTRLVLTQLKKFFWYSLLDQLRLGTFKRTQATGVENFLLAFFFS